jgi:hypothetical protein
MIRKSMIMITKRMTPHANKDPIDLNHALPNIQARMDMQHRTSMCGKGMNIIHMVPRTMGTIEMMMRKATCGSGLFSFVHSGDE